MKIGLIDVDGHNFPNIPLMKISAYHKNAAMMFRGINRYFPDTWIACICQRCLALRLIMNIT